MDKIELRRKFDNDEERLILENNVHILRMRYQTEMGDISTFDPVFKYGIEGNIKINEALDILEKYVADNYPELV